MRYAKSSELRQVDGLVIPGGESTTLLKFILNPDLGHVEAFQEFHQAGKPIFGTCAGLILVAKDVSSPAQFSFGFIDVGVERNAYGRQKESFEAVGEGYLDGPAKPLKMVFIRAPRIMRLGAGQASWRPGMRSRSWPARGQHPGRLVSP